MKFLFATTNSHKVSEVRELLANSPIELVSLAEVEFQLEPPEDGDTFEANALQKAQFVHERTGIPCIADDSGLEVDALGGAPGVHSKRYSAEQTHEANNSKLMAALASETHRTARFRCVLAIVGHGEPVTIAGSCEGSIAHELSGTEGFGYDPIFVPDEAHGRSMAELSTSEKNAISHRGRAFRALATHLLKGA